MVEDVYTSEMAAVFGFGSRTIQVGEMILEWVDIEWAYIRRACSRRFRSAKRATKFSIFGLVLNLNVVTLCPRSNTSGVSIAMLTGRGCTRFMSWFGICVQMSCLSTCTAH